MNFWQSRAKARRNGSKSGTFNFTNNVEIKDKTNRLILWADTVLITFEFQKNKLKKITVTQPRSGIELFPAIVWEKIVLRILSYKGTTKITSVNVVLVGKWCHYIKAAEMYDHITNTVNNTTGLGFSGDDVGNHSIRSSLSMTLYLAKQAVSTIMLIGCWCSDAFLLYVRRQVQEFSAGISADMVAVDHYFAIPDLEECDSLDPRTRNCRSFANTISLNGPNVATAHSKAPALHIWY